MPTQKPETVIKSVKHTFTSDERNQIGGDLARCIGSLRGIEAEFDQVKDSYKAKTAEAEARIDSLSTNMINGFEMRNEPCIVIYDAPTKKKYFYLADNPTDIVIVEPMTQDDFQAELLREEDRKNPPLA